MTPLEFIIILVWVISIIIIIVGIPLYLYDRKISKKIEQMQQNLNSHLNIIDEMKKSKEERLHELVDLKNKIDKMIEEEKINCK
jgi:predicted Holliday junction resolvase-like endonuclease